MFRFGDFRSARNRFSVNTFIEARERKTLSLGITLSLHLLLWLSTCGLILSGYTIAAPVDGTLVPSAILVILASICSIVYVVLHHIFARRRYITIEYGEQPDSPLRQPRYIVARLGGLITLLWLCSTGWGIIVAARRPVCLNNHVGTPPSWQAGLPCRCHRGATAISMLLLVVSCVLFVLMQWDASPFDSHLLGHFSVADMQANDTASVSSDPKDELGAPMIRDISLPLPKDLPPLPKDYETREKHVDPPMSQSRNPVLQGEALSRSAYVLPELLFEPDQPTVIVNTISVSQVELQHPRPIRRIASASSLMPTPKPIHRAHRLHRRSLSAGSVYPQHKPLYKPTMIDYRGSSFMHPATNARSAAPSAWTAVHPPRHGYAKPQRRGTVATIRHGQLGSVPYNNHPYLSRARTAYSSSSSSSSLSSGPYPAASWSNFPMPPNSRAIVRQGVHRATSSFGSSSSGYGRSNISSQLSDHLEEDEDAITEFSSSSNGSNRSAATARYYNERIPSSVRRPADPYARYNVLKKSRSTTAIRGGNW
ncbi:hypothetical protein BT63DRAFT_451843 [Microthyrium microscopicum]|uniref:Uncharacterized protein n=1 Tax=Microthyrium microscopicum TaxID=703497 RepID=A0A6A6UPY5_9PEZI|nr:hypothetical protein BT63DRAFT_451843 [Microthyrium microscopicum]